MTGRSTFMVAKMIAGVVPSKFSTGVAFLANGATFVSLFFHTYLK
jgi:hypothetical protein